MAYSKTTWQDLPSTSTPIDATNLNHIEEGIENNDKRLNGTATAGDIVVDSIRTKNIFGDYTIINGWISNNAMRINNENGNRMAFIECKPNTTYTVSRSDITSSFRVGDYTLIPTMTGSNVDYTLPKNCIEDNSAETITYTTSETAKYLIVHYANIGVDSTETITNSFSSIQVETGSTATTYRPYQGLNTNNLKNKELVVGSIKNKNLISIPNGIYNNNGITATVNNGIITLNGTATSTSFNNIPLLNYFDIPANVSYRISANNSSSVGQTTSGTWAGIRLQTSVDDSDTQSLDFSTSNNSKTISYTSNKTMKFFTIRTASGLSYNNMTIKPQLEVGTTETPFVPNQNILEYDSGWIEATLTNNFTYYSNDERNRPKYRRIGNIVSVIGVVTPTQTIASNIEQTIFTLPNGFRPFREVRTICQGSGMNRWLFSISASGAVAMSRYGVSSQDSVNAGNWLPFNVVFILGV